MTVSKRWNKAKTKFTWSYCITIQKAPKRIQYRKSGFATKQEAQIEEAKALNKFAGGENLKAESLNFKDIAEMYILHCEQNEKAKSTLVNYRNSFQHLDNFHLFKIKEISSLQIENWLIRTKKSKSIKNECLKFGKAVYNYAIKHRVCEYNPFLMVDKLKLEKPKHTRLSIENAFKILELCKDIYPDFYVILITALFTGMREGELLALKWSDIDFNNKELTVQRQYTQYELKEKLKTESSYRKIDLTPELVNILKKHKKDSKILSSFVFVNRAGNLHNPRNLIQRRFEPLLEKMFGDKKYMRFHDLRGTYVDFLLKEGVPLKYIQKSLGHANYLTTMNNYSETIQEVHEHAVNVLDNILQKIV